MSFLMEMILPRKKQKSNAKGTTTFRASTKNILLIGEEKLDTVQINDIIQKYEH